MTMFGRTALAAVIAVGVIGAGGSGPATAQNSNTPASGSPKHGGTAPGVTGWPQRMTELQAYKELQARGYTGIGYMDNDGDHFTADATKDGKQFRVTVDAKSGSILAVPAD